MTGDDPGTGQDATADGAGTDGRTGATRRATITTAHADAATAERVAASLRPDNTAEMATRTEGDRVVTMIARKSTGGLRSTVDDYVVNTTVAARLATDSDARTTRSDTQRHTTHHE